MPATNPPTDDPVRLTADGSEAAVALAGAQPVLWRVAGRDLLWSGDPAHWGWHAPLLFPVVGQVKGGRVRIAGQSFDMPRHGFARISQFRCLDRTDSSVRLRLETGASAIAFPLPFRLDVTVTLQARSLALDVTVGNPGAGPLPYAVGFHPAFPWPFEGGSQAGYEVRFEADEPAEVPVVTPEGLLGRDTRTVPLQGSRLPLDPDLFRDDALVFLGARSRRWSFAAPSGAAIEMRVDGFPHLALWTKPGSPFLSLEAWTGHADPDGFAGELVDKPSMIRLPPGGERRHRVELHFRAPDARAL